MKIVKVVQPLLFLAAFLFLSQAHGATNNSNAFCPHSMNAPRGATKEERASSLLATFDGNSSPAPAKPSSPRARKAVAERSTPSNNL